MAIERKFLVELNGISRKWYVVAVGFGNIRLPIAEGREEIFAESLAARLNEAYADSFEEVKYLIAATHTA